MIVDAWLQHPTPRFIAHDMFAPLRRWTAGEMPSELGFKALRVIPWLWEAPPTDRRHYPLYAACVELGIPFCTQVGHTGPLRPSETGRAPRQALEHLDALDLDRETRELFLAGNARRVFGLA